MNLRIQCNYLYLYIFLFLFFFWNSCVDILFFTGIYLIGSLCLDYFRMFITVAMAKLHHKSTKYSPVGRCTTIVTLIVKRLLCFKGKNSLIISYLTLFMCIGLYHFLPFNCGASEYAVWNFKYTFSLSMQNNTKYMMLFKPKMSSK